jgi:ribosomal protein RSM22 (predicted rRNA methylase)
VLVEPGTPQGFARIRAARAALLAQQAVPVAPCPHAADCPIMGEDWCHFSVRLARSRAHMHAKAARVPFEDERFAYLIMARDGVASGGGRIIAPPQHLKPGSRFRLCTQGRIEERLIARRDGALYKQASKLDWGDLMPPAMQKDAP